MNNELYHYGVLGMKWGVRRNATRAYEKAYKKKTELENKLAKREARYNRTSTEASEATLKSNNYDARRFRRINESKSQKLYEKKKKAQTIAAKDHIKMMKAKKKAERWSKKMNKVFNETYLSSVEVPKNEIDSIIRQMS